MSVNNKITIVIVIYNSTDIIFNCLKHLNDFDIIIVNNGKNAKVLDKLSSKNNIKIISPGKNVGMGKGANFAFESIQTDFFFITKSWYWNKWGFNIKTFYYNYKKW